MSTLIYIGLVGIMAYNCKALSINFKGSSEFLKHYFGLSGLIGYPVQYALLIWSFFHFTWWMPIVTYVASVILAGFSAIIFQSNSIGAIVSPILLVVFTAFSVIGLL